MASRRRSRTPDHGLGAYNRDYEYVRQQLLDLDDADQKIVDAIRSLRAAVASGSASQAFRAKSAAQSALGAVDDTLRSADITERLGTLDRLPRNGFFLKAHDLMSSFRTQLARVHAERRALSRVAFGSIDEMRERLSQTPERDRRRLTRVQQRRVARRGRDARRIK